MDFSLTTISSAAFVMRTFVSCFWVPYGQAMRRSVINGQTICKLLCTLFGKMKKFLHHIKTGFAKNKKIVVNYRYDRY